MASRRRLLRRFDETRLPLRRHRSLVSLADGLWRSLPCIRKSALRKAALGVTASSTLGWLLGASPALALNPSLDVSQYAHRAWTVTDGFSIGAIFAMAQTPDGYLWLGSEFGLYRFDGIHAVRWLSPEGQPLPSAPYSLLVTRDGILWIGTFAGLFSWNGSKLTQYPEIGGRFVTSLLEDREGTVWAGIMGHTSDAPAGQLCAIRSGRVQCYSENGAFGTFVWSLSEDNSGALWVGADSGVWRWKPGPPRRYAMPGMRVGDLTTSDDGRLLIGITRGGLKQIVADRLEVFPIKGATNRTALLSDREVNSNKLLRDRDGGLWIGRRDRGLIHIHNDRTDVFTEFDGLSGDISCSLFEDREGNVWFASSRGLDRFRDLPITEISTKQSLSSNSGSSLVAGTDGSIWVGTRDGLNRWRNGQITIFRKASGLPDDAIQSLFQDDHGRIWAYTDHGLAYFNHNRFVAVPDLPTKEVFSMTGDRAGNLWLSGNQGLLHMRDGRLVENFPWPVMGRHQQAKVVLPDRGGVWLAFSLDGGVLYFKDGQVRASYTPAEGLGKGAVGGIQIDRDGALWAATQDGGLSRIKNGRVATLTTKNGLPCDTIHWLIEDDDRSLWLYTACGLVRINRSELEAWIADPKRRIEITLWDAQDGVTLTAGSPAYYNPPVSKAADGKLWFLMGEGVAIVDTRHLAINRLPPPVHIERIVADHKIYWQNLAGAIVPNLRLPPRTRDLQINYTALSLVAPEKVHFKYKLEGQDTDWREVINDREVQYSNLAPGYYRFRVKASNNSGVWNEEGAFRDFAVEPAYWQTNWFRAACAAALLLLIWAIHRLRLRQLHHQFEMTLDARVGERTRIARDLHDTLLQSFHSVLLRLETVSQLMREHPIEAQEKLDSTIDQVAEAITEGRDAVQGLRESTLQSNDLAVAISTLGEELATDSTGHRPPAFRVAVEGDARDLHPIVRDEIYRIAAEALRNAFQHAQARQVEVEIRYDDQQFRLRVRDDGKGINPAVPPRQDNMGHFGLSGMRERATLIGGNLTVWSEANSGTEVELSLPGGTAYTTARTGSWLSRKFAGISKG
jgi:signal transduction histidine kinase/ligand-binding sensor domain-containing protein